MYSKFTFLLPFGTEARSKHRIPYASLSTSEYQDLDNNAKEPSIMGVKFYPADDDKFYMKHFG